jgi:hypothetical protein
MLRKQPILKESCIERMWLWYGEEAPLSTRAMAQAESFLKQKTWKTIDFG